MRIGSATLAVGLLIGAHIAGTPVVAGRGAPAADITLTASPIDQFPYTFGYALNLPGTLDGAPTNVVGTSSFGFNSYDQAYLTDDGGYSTHVNGFYLPLLLFTQTEDVDASTVSLPPLGTHVETVGLFPILPLVGFVPLATSIHVDDPVHGTASITQFLPLLSANVFVSNSAGVEDQLIVAGQTYTLFSFPSGAAEASPMAEALADGLLDGHTADLAAALGDLSL